MKPCISFFAILTLCCFTSTARAQVAPTTAEQRDSVQVQSISIADLEMIVPENRLRPEPDTNEEQIASNGYVESPFSATHPQRAANQDAKLTAKDLEMLENIAPSEQAGESPSR